MLNFQRLLLLACLVATLTKSFTRAAAVTSILDFAEEGEGEKTDHTEHFKFNRHLRVYQANPNAKPTDTNLLGEETTPSNAGDETTSIPIAGKSEPTYETNILNPDESDFGKSRQEPNEADNDFGKSRKVPNEADNLLSRREYAHDVYPRTTSV